ncbi:neuroglobin-like [Littorina saxatilis]|uniref:Globin n=1 Tax=Littorina saxatilis TaxID=31220 RepID=A0AAN9ASR3_9CAEN
MGSCFGCRNKAFGKNEDGEIPLGIKYPSGLNIMARRNSKKKALELKPGRKGRPTMSIWVARGMPDARPKFSSRDKHIVRESWGFLRTSMFKVGKIMFCEMLEAVPKIKELFRNNAKNEALRDDIEYLAIGHAQRVMVTVDKVIKIIDAPSKVAFYMHEVGDRHAEMDVRIEYLDLFVPYFITAIHPSLDERWASKIEDAWGAFFTYIVHLMKESMVF